MHCLINKDMNNREAREIAKKFVDIYRNQIVEAYLFGSTADGKAYPRDVDILIIKKNKARLNFNGFPDIDKINYIVYTEDYAKKMLEERVGDYKFYQIVLEKGERLI